MKKPLILIMVVTIFILIMSVNFLASSTNNPVKMVGDLDFNGEINDQDGELLAQYLAGWNVSVPDVMFFDIDGDGEITDWDGVMFDRYLAGWSVDTEVGKKLSFNITYLNTKGANNSNPTSYNVYSSTITLTNLYANGYIFDGWYNGNVKVTSIPSGSSGNLVLTAKWTPCDYTITYSNEKGAANNNVAVFNIESDTIFLSDLQKEGYIFNGWYRDGIKVTEITKGTIGNIELTAKWTPCDYTITYSNTKGVVNNNPTSYSIESNDIFLKDLSLSGYVFLGWFDENGQVTVIPKGSIGNIILTAKWEPLYNITYTNTKSATNKNPTSYSANDEIIELLDLTKTGYTFNGWFLGETRITHIDPNEKKDITLEAKWIANQYIVTIDGNGGYVSPKKITVTYGEPMPDYSATLIRRGYDFTGLYSTSGHKYYNGDLTSARTWNIASDTTLTARWSEQPYQVTTNGPFIVSGYEIEFPCDYYFTAEETGSYYIQIYHQSTKCRGYKKNVGYWCCLHGFEISVWNESDNPLWLRTEGLTSGDYIYETSFDSSDVGTSYTNYKNFENDTRFEISFDVKKGETYRILAYTTNREYYEYSSDYNYDYTKSQSHNTSCYGNNATYRVTKENGDIVFVCEKDKVHDIAYENTKDAVNNNSGKHLEGITQTLQDLSKSGYIFEGWYLNGEKVTTLSNITSDITLEARWSPIEYTATFYIDNQVVGTTKFSADNYVITEFPELPRKEGYTSSWEYQLALKDISITAKYTPIEYDITYLNVGNSTNHNATHYNTFCGVLLYPLSRTGCDFIGWMNDDGDIVTAIPFGSLGNVTLTAVWDNYIEYTVEFADNRYGSIVENITYNVDSEAIILPQLTDKTDYYFEGWYSGNTKYTTIPQYSTGDLKLTAKWVSKDISYGTPSVSNISLSGGSASVRSISTEKSWDSSKKAWRVTVAVEVRVSPNTYAAYEVRMGTLYFGMVSFQGFGSYETQTQTVTMYLSPGTY